jgi:hypothetical protein
MARKVEKLSVAVKNANKHGMYGDGGGLWFYVGPSTRGRSSTPKRKARKLEAAKAITFKACAKKYIAANKSGWRNEKPPVMPIGRTRVFHRGRHASPSR